MRGYFGWPARCRTSCYRKEVGAFFKSLHGTLNHLLAADRIWMRRLTGVGDHPDKLNAILLDDLPSLHAARLEEDSRITGFVQGLDEPAFEEVLEYRTLDGAPQRQRRREILAHLFNHETHHRGQAHAISRCWASPSLIHSICLSCFREQG